MKRLLPDPSGDERSRFRETHVLCDFDSCESIPENPFEWKVKIEYLIETEGYSGQQVSFWMVASEKTFPADLVDMYGNAGLGVVIEGDKDVMVHDMLREILFWAMRSRKPGNLLVLSGNKNFGQDKFASIRQSMENKGFYVTVAPFESVTKVELPHWEGACYCPQ